MLKSKIVFCLLFAFLLSACNSNQSKPTDEKESNPSYLHFSANEKYRKNHNIVLISGDEEYRSEESLPMLAKILSKRHGFNCSVLFAQDPEQPGIINPNYTKNIPGLELLESADLIILATRFRALPDDQMQYFENYLKAGRPIIAIRTATHAFHFKDSTSLWKHWGNYYDGEQEDWQGGFGMKVLGLNWVSHHGHHKHQSTRAVFPEKKHSILSGINDGGIWGPSDVYGFKGRKSNQIETILYGAVIDREGDYDETDLLYGMSEFDDQLALENPASKGYHPNEPLTPVVWTLGYQVKDGAIGKSITSTIGSSTDFLNEELRRLIVNSAYYLLGFPVLEKADVEYRGDYSPSQFKFHSDEYWIEKNLKVSDLE